MRKITMKLPSYTISNKYAIQLIEELLARFPIGEDEPISGCDAVDVLGAIRDICNHTHFLPKKRGK